MQKAVESGTRRRRLLVFGILLSVFVIVNLGNALHKGAILKP